MKRWLHFVGIGLALGLFTEFVLRLVAGVNPPAFGAALLFYPAILTAAYALHRLLSRGPPRRWADLAHYFGCGLAGLWVEWNLLGNGPDSNAFQLGMFAMWTTFCFGPRVLTRDAPAARHLRRPFWRAFVVTAVVIVVAVALAPDRQAKLVTAVLTLSGTNIAWSGWLLVTALRDSGTPGAPRAARG